MIKDCILQLAQQLKGAISINSSRVGMPQTQLFNSRKAQGFSARPLRPTLRHEQMLEYNTVVDLAQAH